MVQPHPRAVAALAPDRTAIVFVDTGETLSYGELVVRADRAARLIADLGVAAGDTIAILAENHIRYAELCWAAKNSGLYYVCISNHLNIPDLAYILENCGARLLFTTRAQFDNAVAARAAMAAPPRMLLIDGECAGADNYPAMLADTPADPPRGRMAGASMLYSSGTTGRPKAVRPPLEQRWPEDPPRRHKMLTDIFEFAPDSVFINPGPLYHAAPLRKMMATLRLGGLVVLFEQFAVEPVLAAIARHRGTHAFFVPTMFVRLLRHRAEGQPIPDLSSLRSVVHGAAPCPPSVKQAMIDWLGPVIHEIYGGTEGVGHTTIRAEEWLAHKGSVGKPPPGCRMRIVDGDGQLLGPNQPGLIYMANGNSFAYYGDEAKTRAAHDADGYATYGDIGYIDDDGYLYLTDRQSHMIISGGVNIYPQEAENILIDHPQIADVAVIGIPHDEFGEEVRAIVEPVTWPADEAALAADIIGYCRERLSAMKCPRGVDFVAELPRNAMGKVVKRDLRRRYWEGRETLIG